MSRSSGYQSFYGQLLLITSQKGD